MTASYALRPAEHFDVPGIAQVLDAASRRWTGRPTAEEQVRERLDTPGTDLSLDTVVAAGDQLLGFGHLWPAPPNEIRCFARTHPDHRGKGIGAALQRHLVARARERAADAGGTLLTTTTWARDPGSDAVLTGVGYTPERFFQKMVLRYGAAPTPTSPPPAGVEIRGYAEGADDEPLFDAFVESFADHWGTEHPDKAEWWRERRDLASAAYDPTLWIVAVANSALVGFVIARILEAADGNPHGYIGDLGVRPEWRGRGLGQALLTRSLVTLRERDLALTYLDVDTDNTTGALRTYERAGMEREPAFTIWSQRLR